MHASLSVMRFGCWMNTRIRAGWMDGWVGGAHPLGRVGWVGVSSYLDGWVDGWGFHPRVSG